MAAKRARPTDKKSLVRQDIANRRRAIQEKKLSTSSTGRRAILGVFVLAVSLLALVAVGSFSAQDRIGPGYQNAIGPVGHGIAEALRGLLGICAYVLPLAGLYGAMVMFVGARDRTRWPQVLAAALLCVSTAVLAQLFWGAEPGWSHPPGGLIGVGLGNELSGLFSTVGTVILVTAVSVAALIVGMQQLFLRLCAAGWSVAQSAGAVAKTQGALFLERQKQAMVVRREAAAQAKLEEAAFLAQLEADEEELAAAEREAAEADAMAEEAVRLTREAEQKAEAAKAPRKPLLEKQPLCSPALLARLPRAAPVEPPALPPGDPAWASSLLSTPVAAASPVPEASEPPRKRKQPQIIAAPQASIPPIPAVDLTPAIAPAVAMTPVVAAPISLPPPAAVKEPAAASTALARMPLIVEPKAPPKPTKKVQEQFHFVGDRKSFTLPPLDVLEFEKAERTALDKDVFLATAEKLRAKLADFGIVGEVVEIRPGPVVTMYEFLPGPGIKVSKIASLQDDLAMAMEAMRVRIVAPIPGKGVVGIEVPNRDRETVFLKEIVEQDIFQKASSRLTMSVGKDIEGMPYLLDLAKAPHILMAGTTGSGKSVAVNSMIMSILLKATPEEVRFIMVDPKMLELSVYEGIPHLLLPVVTDPKKAALALRWAVEEMERRYHLLSEAGVRNIAGYNKLVESAQGAAKELLRNPGAQVVEAKAAAPAAEPKKPAAKKKLLIVDVAQGESEDEALARASAANELGVPAPREELEDAREPLPEEEPALAASEAEAAEEDDDAPLPELAAASGGEEEEPGEKEKPELKKLPYIVVIIDELADLMMVASREVETYVARLAQMARASGIHLMVATQRPSTDVVTGVIKANFPTRISFMLRSKPDSMTILGTVGAEALLGMGDMLIMPPTSSHMQRVHGAYVSEEEIKRAVDHLKAQGKPVYDESILKAREEDSEGGGEEDELSDDLYDQALATVTEMRQVSISMLQRKMRIGYNRAARMIERMERDGVVGPADGAKPREVLLRPVGEMPGAGAM
ncbi:MAG: DNA translocase FtsK 4TM domain-containing protein [Myxococcota bacterium]|nr:DNA translocase FtsK 4TM domain-containing protein [Myxococcota bacterium]